MSEVDENRQFSNSKYLEKDTWILLSHVRISGCVFIYLQVKIVIQVTM